MAGRTVWLAVFRKGLRKVECLVLPLWLDAQIGHQDKPAEKGQKTTILIEVPVSGRLGYLTTTDA